MSSAFGRLTRDLIGCSLRIYGKRVIDSDANINVGHIRGKSLTIAGQQISFDENGNIVQSHKGYIHGLDISYVSENTIEMAVGSCRDQNDSPNGNMKITSPLTINLSTSGAGGLDTGSKTSNTWYAVYLIGDTSKTLNEVGILSESASSPVLPNGYDMFRRVGWIKNGPDNKIIPFTMRCTGESRSYCWDTDLLQAGLYGVLCGVSGVWTSVNLSQGMPVTAPKATLKVVQQITGTTITQKLEIALRATGTNNPDATAVGQAPGSAERENSSVYILNDTNLISGSKTSSQVEICVGDDGGEPSIDFVSTTDTFSTVKNSIFISGFEDTV